MEFGQLTVVNSTISNNITGTSADGGGGIYNVGPITLTNTTVSGNQTEGSGGGILNIGGQTVIATFTNSTIARNYSGSNSDSGGGISTSAFSSTTILKLVNTIVAGNLRSSGTISSDIFGPIDTGSSFNLIGDGTGMTGMSNGSGGNQVGTAAAPINPRLGALPTMEAQRRHLRSLQ